MRLVGVITVGGLVLAAGACGKPPASNSGASGAPGGGKATHACMVTDIGGINDRSFNASAWAGMQAANKQNGNIKVDYVQSRAEADYGPNLNGYVQQQRDLIAADGALLQDATTASAKANPDHKVAIVDRQLTAPHAD